MFIEKMEIGRGYFNLIIFISKIFKIMNYFLKSNTLINYGLYIVENVPGLDAHFNGNVLKQLIHI
jgi:hypothetical protein